MHDSSRPRLSVVVGAVDAPGLEKAITDCLAAIDAQLDSTTVEAIFVINSDGIRAAEVRRCFPRMEVLIVPSARFVPDLWERGIEESRGEIVAITAAGFLPREDWIEQIMAAHTSAAVATGGAIEKLEPASLLAWAVYFCRYSQFMLPLAKGPTVEIAGENASYKRSALDACRASWRNGFWEPTVHAEIRKLGGHLSIDPGIVVDYSSTFGFGAFVRQRFWHGRQFGSARSRRVSSLLRLAYLLASPIVPLLLLCRIAGRVVSKARHLQKLILCVPLMTIFLCAWAIGEASGYLIPQSSQTN
jgi:hypothetical protein